MEVEAPPSWVFGFHGPPGPCHPNLEPCHQSCVRLFQTNAEIMVSLKIKAPSQKAYIGDAVMYVWRVQVPSEKVLGS